MKKISIGKKYLIAIVMLMAVVAGISIPAAYAANVVEPDKECSLTLSVGESGTIAEDLKDTLLSAHLYRVASVDSYGHYTLLEPYDAALDETKQDILFQQTDGNENREELQILASDIYALAGKTETASASIKEGTVTVDYLEPGIYLVGVDDVMTQGYSYTFSPYFICLPNLVDEGYVYDITSTLKPAQKARSGNLEIHKTLTSFNDSLNDVTFVFLIEGVDDTGEKVYSNVVSATFDQAGTKTILVEGIPADATFTVTEVYSGASYSTQGNKSVEVESVPNDTVSVEFKNYYDGGLIPGFGVTNHFEYDEKTGWQWTQLSDNSASNR